MKLNYFYTFPYLLAFVLFIYLRLVKKKRREVSQCSEICGAYHGFMPICIEGTTIYDYLTWLSTTLVAPMYKRIYVRS